MTHGTNTAYLGGCRCDACSLANYQRTKRYRLLTGAGEDGKPVRPLTVDAEPIRRHVAALVASGWTRTGIAQEVGQTVYWLWQTVDRKSRSATGGRRILATNAAALLALQSLQPVAVDEVVVERLVAGADWRTIGATRAERIAAADLMPSRSEAERRLGLRAGRDFGRKASA